MKIYVIDYGCYGMSVVVASSIQEAIGYFLGTENFCEEDYCRIKEHDIECGLVLENTGDR